VENFQAIDDSAVVAVDPRLEGIVNRMFQRFFDEKKFKQAIGIAVETRRLDMFEKAIVTSVGIFFFLIISITTVNPRLLCPELNHKLII
jgi:26S proteasome regulatory subunit N2